MRAQKRALNPWVENLISIYCTLVRVNSFSYQGQRLAAVLIAVAALAAEGDRKFGDPAPPVVRPLAASAVPAPQRNGEVTFHAKPKPLPAGAVTHDWTSFLGPTHNAMSTETRLLHNWPKTGPKLVWEMKKGTAYSSPAISGDRLLFIHRVGKEERVECLHRETGERFWQYTYPTGFEDRYGYNNGPRASPVIDGDRVYTYGAEGKLHCLKLETGQVYWKRDLRGEFKVPPPMPLVSVTVITKNRFPMKPVSIKERPQRCGRHRPHHADRLVQGGAREGYRQPLGQGASGEPGVASQDQA